MSLLTYVGVVLSISRCIVVNFAVKGRHALSSSSLHLRGPRGASSALLLLRRGLKVGRRDGDCHWRIVLRVWFWWLSLILVDFLQRRFLRLWNYEIPVHWSHDFFHVTTHLTVASSQKHHRDGAAPLPTFVWVALSAQQPQAQRTTSRYFRLFLGGYVRVGGGRWQARVGILSRFVAVDWQSRRWQTVLLFECHQRGDGSGAHSGTRWRWKQARHRFELSRVNLTKKDMIALKISMRTRKHDQNTFYTFLMLRLGIGKPSHRSIVRDSRSILKLSFDFRRSLLIT